MEIEIVERQALHQWRMIWDGEYRLWYVELLEECGVGIGWLVENKLMFVPVAEMY